MKVNLDKVNFETPIWYKETECRVVHLSKVCNPNADYKMQWTIALVDKEYAEYLKKSTSYRKKHLKMPTVYTCVCDWECIEADCWISNAIDFIRNS